MHSRAFFYILTPAEAFFIRLNDDSPDLVAPWKDPLKRVHCRIREFGGQVLPQIDSGFLGEKHRPGNSFGNSQKDGALFQLDVPRLYICNLIDSGTGLHHEPHQNMVSYVIPWKLVCLAPGNISVAKPPLLMLQVKGLFCWPGNFECEFNRGTNGIHEYFCDCQIPGADRLRSITQQKSPIGLIRPPDKMKIAWGKMPKCVRAPTIPFGFYL